MQQQMLSYFSSVLSAAQFRNLLIIASQGPVGYNGLSSLF
ncbi:hypothetical protein PALB_36350 [Pseudoalteromonas luteoviolacea B = ATCC 29581]|nr:hypothetical protein PALB_36350 [Pseudoalteromonas luteoviolacea B = ATCC 29581]